jgi:hypothetical protein
MRDHRRAPLTTKSISREPHSERRNRAAQSVSAVAAPYCRAKASIASVAIST